MDLSLRQFSTAVLLTVGLTGVTLYRTENLLALHEPQSVEIAPSPPEVQVVIRRMQRKSEAVAELIRGKITLFEAAAQFRRFNSEPCECPNLGWQEFAGATIEEKVCRQVIRWVEGQLVDRMSAMSVQAQIEQLEATLKHHLANHGKVMLPGDTPER